MKYSIDIVCPSRSSKQQTFFLDRMINSVKQNSYFELVDLRFLICIDHECSISLPNHDVDIIVVNSDGHSQAKALNAGLRKCKGDFRSGSFVKSRVIDILVKELNKKKGE